MPVYFVSVNAHGRREPELWGIVTSRVTPEAALHWLLEEWPRRVDDVAVEVLADVDNCWYVKEPRRAA